MVGTGVALSRPRRAAKTAPPELEPPAPTLLRISDKKRAEWERQARWCALARVMLLAGRNVGYGREGLYAVLGNEFVSEPNIRACIDWLVSLTILEKRKGRAPVLWERGIVPALRMLRVFGREPLPYPDGEPPVRISHGGGSTNPPKSPNPPIPRVPSQASHVKADDAYEERARIASEMALRQAQRENKFDATWGDALATATEEP